MAIGMPWIRVDVTAEDHPKCRDLAELLDDPNSYVYVDRLWRFTGQWYPTGALPIGARRLEEALRWRGKAGRLVGMLVQTRLLDGSEGAYSVHGWSDFNGGAHKKITSDRERRKAERDARQSNDSRRTVERASGDSREIVARQSNDSPATNGTERNGTERRERRAQEPPSSESKPSEPQPDLTTADRGRSISPEATARGSWPPGVLEVYDRWKEFYGPAGASENPTLDLGERIRKAIAREQKANPSLTPAQNLTRVLDSIEGHQHTAKRPGFDFMGPTSGNLRSLDRLLKDEQVTAGLQLQESQSAGLPTVEREPEEDPTAGVWNREVVPPEETRRMIEQHRPAFMRRPRHEPNRDPDAPEEVST